MPRATIAKRSLVTLLLCAGLPACAAPPAGWNLVWSDEFDGSQIDGTKWTHEVNGWGGGNNELQYYTARPVNSRIESGKLVIEARREDYTGPDGFRRYTSARLNTRYKADFLYGRVEVRAKMPGRQGLWPAIWMLPTDYVYGAWAASGEIDIAEHRGDLPTTLYTTIHHGGVWPANTYTGHETTVPDLSADFHDFAMEWEANEIRWYFDGAKVYSVSDWYSTEAPYPAPFDKRFHILLNVAVGGNFLPDPPDNPDYFPRRMEVEYVRVYAREPIQQAPFLSEPAPVPGRIQAEDFDIGGSSVAYYDDTPENLGETYRLDESVDIGDSNDDGTPSVGWYGGGEWMEYTVNVAEAGSYVVRARHGGEPDNVPLSLQLRDGDTVLEQLSANVPSTGSWTSWTMTELGEIELPAGEAVLRLTAPGAAVNVNWFELETAEPPPTGLGPGWIVY